MKKIFHYGCKIIPISYLIRRYEDTLLYSQVKWRIQTTRNQLQESFDGEHSSPNLPLISEKGRTIEFDIKIKEPKIKTDFEWKWKKKN